MKKILCILVSVMLLAGCLAGCGFGKFECDICGEEKFGVKIEEEFLGQTIEYCKDCKGELEEFKDKMEDLGDSLSDGWDGLKDSLQEGLEGLEGSLDEF